MQELLDENADPNSSRPDADKTGWCRICRTKATETDSTVCSQCQGLLSYGPLINPELLAYNIEAETHPKIRFAARILDLSIYNLSLIVLTPLYTIPLPSLLRFGIIIAISICFEAFLMSTVGATLGKIWFGVRVINSDGSLLSLKQAAVRAIRVWYRGLGLCISGLSQLTELTAYSQLKMNGITSWDRDGSFVVSHEELSTMRIIIGIMLISVCQAISGSIIFHMKQ